MANVLPQAVPIGTRRSTPEFQAGDLMDLGDAPAMRKSIYSKVLSATQNLPPLSNRRHTLKLRDVDYVDPEEFTLKQQKEAILGGKTLSRRLRGTWELYDNTTGQKLDEKQSTVAQVPFLSNRGTIIHNGSEYTISNQLRLRPGIYTREKENGEIEAHVNILPGNGVSHRYFLDPAKSIFKIHLEQADIPLVSLVRALGATDRQLQDAWGPEIYAANSRYDNPATLHKLYRKFVRNPDAAADQTSQFQAVADAVRAMKMDGEVNQKTLGQAYDHLDLDTILATTKKLIGISRGEQETDDRDHLAFQTVHSADDMFAERIAKDYGGLRRALLHKLSFKGNLKGLPTGALTKQLQAVIFHSGLAQNLEEVNPADILDKTYRVSRLGEGGIPSVEVVPDEARSVQPSHLGFLDPVRTPESFKAGVDIYLSNSAKKGPDGRLYTPLRDLKTGKTVYRSPQELANLTLAFPGEMASQAKRIAGMRGGRLGYYPKTEVDFEVPAFEQIFSALGSMVPLKSGVKAQRMSMASRMLTQAMAVSDPEAPLVQTGIPGSKDDSYERLFGSRLGAVTSEQGGRVMSVSPDEIVVRQPDGTLKKHELFHNFPFNRKSYIHNTPLVRPGDQIQPGAVLAKSNYTDNSGVAAIGKNARVGYIPFRGLNFEDAIVVSESFAKKMASEHMYQHGLDLTEDHKVGLKNYLGLFPGRYSRQILSRMDDDGVVKEGTVVNHGEPLILAAKQRELGHHKIHRKREAAFSDASVEWEHHAPGVVTDVFKGPKGTLVSVKSLVPSQIGDKMCFDSATSLLTRQGWKSVAEITYSDEIATLSKDGHLEYQRPTHVWTYAHDGPMYYLNTKQLNMLVTLNHRLWVARPGQDYEAVTAEDFFKSRGEWQFKKDCKWAGQDRALMEFGKPSRQYQSRTQVLTAVPMDDWLTFLGFYLAEGWVTPQGYVKLGQFRKSTHWQKIHETLQRLGLRHRYDDAAGRFEICNVWLAEYLQPLGDSYTKYVPGWVQELSPRQLRIFLDAYLAGDGHKGNCWEFGSSSKRLAEDIGVICLKLGWAVNLKEQRRADNWQKQAHWRGRINKKQLRPRWKKSRQRYLAVTEEIVDYHGSVHCVTVPNHVIYCKREEKTYWSHNSGRYG